MKPNLKIYIYVVGLIFSLLCLTAQLAPAQSSWWWWYQNANGCVSYNGGDDKSVCGPADVTVSISDIKFKSGSTSYSVYWSLTPFTSTPSGNGTGASYTVNGVNKNTPVYFYLKDNKSSCAKSGSLNIIASSPGASGKAAISNLQSSYCSSGLKTRIYGIPAGGIFYGPGITSGGTDVWYFDPTVPSPGNHVIRYVAGCTTPAEQKVTINSGPCTSTLVGAGSGAIGFISSPQGITTTCTGKIYFSDSNNNKIWVIDENGARPVIDTAGIRGNTVGIAANARLNVPTGLTSYNGIIYFCDQVSHNIKSYNPTTNMVEIIAGDNATVPAAGDLDGIGTAARFKNPFGITIDAAGKTLYVSDATTYKIKKIDIATKAVTTIAGSVKGDYPSGTGEVSALTAQFFEPGHLAFYDNYLYITDSKKSVIKKLNLSTNMVSVTFKAEGQLPTGIDVDCDGNIFYSDLSSNKIFRLYADGHTEDVPVTGLDAPSAISIYNRGYIDVANFTGNSVMRGTIKNWKESAFIGLKTYYCNTETAPSIINSTICRKNYGITSYSAPAEYVGGQWQFNPNGKSPGVYSVKYLFSSGTCKDSLSQDVYVFATPELEPLQILSDGFCGDYAIIAKIKDAAASPLDTIIWKNQKGEIIKVSAGSSDTLYLSSVAASPDYTAFAKNPACSFSLNSGPSTFKGMKIKKLPDNVAICAGSSFGLKAEPLNIKTANSIEWTPSSLVGDASSLLTSTVELYTTTLFKITINVANCITTDSIKVIVNPKPASLAGDYPTIYTLCPGADTLIGSSINSKDGITYSWQYNSPGYTKYIDIRESTPSVRVNIPSNVVVPAGRYYLPNNYKLISTNEFGCVMEDPVTIAIFSIPQVNMGNDVTICKGESIQIGVQPDANKYLWNADPTISNINVPNPIVTPKVTTSYIVKVTGTGDCSNYDTIKVTLKALPPKAAIDRIVGMCDGDPAILGPKNPSSNYKYEWSPATGLDNYQIPNPKATPSVSGTVYTLTMKDASGTPVCSDTAKVTVKIASKPVNVVAETVPGNLTGICPGNAIGLNVPSGNGYKVAWSPAATLNDSTLWTPIAKPAVTTRYKVKVTTGDGCSDTSSVEVIVDKISVDAGTDIMFCPGDSGKLNGTYQSVTPLKSQKWSGDIDGISNAAGVSDLQDFNAFVKIAEGTSKKYYLKVTNSNDCSVSDSVIVTASIKPIADAGEDTGDCIGNTFMLGGVGNPSLPSTYSFSWTPGNYTDARPSVSPTTAGINTFILKVKDNATNCTAADTVELTIRPKPVKDEIVSNSPQACDGVDVTLSVNPNSSFVSWIDQTNTLLEEGPTLNVNTDGTYYAIFEQNQCYDTSKYTIDFMAPPVISSIESPLKSCMADGIPLKVITSQGDGVLLYEWTVASSTGVFSTPEKDSTFFKSDNASLASGVKTFTVKVSNQCGNVTLDKDVTFVPSPEASFRADGPSKSLDNTSKETMDAISGDIISFINTVDTVAQNISTWKWDFKDGNTSDLFNSSYTYSNPGKYNVELTVVNKDGCSSVASLGVEVLSSKYLFVPNIFNPYSRNPENSVCKVYGLNISSQSFTFRVFNKWGEVVFETSDFNMANRKGWDGQNAPMGVYTYMVVGKFNDGSEFEKSGTVTLVR